MKKQEHNTTKTSFLTKFKNTKIGVKIIIIGGILALVATTIIVPIVVANKGDSSNPKPNVDNRENDNNEDDKNEDDNQQRKTDSYVPWHGAYNGALSTWSLIDVIQSEYDYINDQISTTEVTHPGNQAFMTENQPDIPFNQMSKIGINKDEVLKNKDNDKIVVKSIRFLGYDFGTSKTFANVFYQLKEDYTKWYRETIEITGFGKPKIVPSDSATIASSEFENFVLPKDFIVSSDLSTIRYDAFKYASFVNEAKFSLAKTQVKSIPQYAFYYATLPNGFALNPATNSIEQFAFGGVKFDKEAVFSLAQTQVKSIPQYAFFITTLPNGFALNPATNSIEGSAFDAAIFDKEAKFSLAKTNVKSIPSNAFSKTILPNGFALNPATNSIEKEAFYSATFEKDAKFSLAQTQVKAIPNRVFYETKLPNDFALNPATTSIEKEAFYRAHLNPGFKIPNTVISIAQDAFQDAILPSGYAWYDKSDNKQTITVANYPIAGWYVGKI